MIKAPWGRSAPTGGLLSRRAGTCGGTQAGLGGPGKASREAAARSPAATGRTGRVDGGLANGGGAGGREERAAAPRSVSSRWAIMSFPSLATVQSAAVNAHGQGFVRFQTSRHTARSGRAGRAAPLPVAASPPTSQTTVAAHESASHSPRRTKCSSRHQNKGKSLYLKLFVLLGPVRSGKHRLVLQGQKHRVRNIAQTVPPPLKRAGRAPMALCPLLTPTAPPQP